MGAAMKIDLKSRMAAPSTAAAFSMMMGGSIDRGDIQQLPIELLVPYEAQPFKPYSPERLAELAADIKANGVLSPAIVRPKEEVYQILAGHNRVNASRIAGRDTVPCIIRDVDDGTAMLIMVNTNLNQRQGLLPSEKAFAYKMQMDAFAENAANQEENELVHIVHKVDNLSLLSDVAQESRRNISYYIRLTLLISELLDMVDAQAIPVRAGVELSYLDQDTQRRLLEYVKAFKIKLDLKKSTLLRENSSCGELTRAEIEGLLSGSKPAKEKTVVKFKRDALNRFFPGKTEQEMQAEVIEILERHFKENG